MDLGRFARSGVIRLKRRARDLAPAEARRGRRDAQELGREWPWLSAYEARARGVRRRLEGDHRYYVREVGHPVHAASLELAVFLFILCEERRPERLVDLGSGFSSYVLRRWAAEQGPPSPEVWSVDDSAEWLERSRGFLESRGLPTGRLLTWEELGRAAPPPFDLVLHDMGSMETRARTLREAVELARPGGIVVLDDVHKPEYRAFARREVEAMGRRCLSLRAFTRDALTRYAWVVFA